MNHKHLVINDTYTLLNAAIERAQKTDLVAREVSERIIEILTLAMKPEEMKYKEGYIDGYNKALQDVLPIYHAAAEKDSADQKFTEPKTGRWWKFWK